MFNIKLVRALSELSKIEMNDAELSELTEDMKNIAAVMDKVLEFEYEDTSCFTDGLNYDELRDDIPEKSLPENKIFQNSDSVENGCFTVPKIM